MEAAYVKGVLQAASLSNASGVRDQAQQRELRPGAWPQSSSAPIVTFTWILLYKEGIGTKLPVPPKSLGLQPVR